MAPSTSNFASPRVLPPFRIASAISSSRAACSALLQAFKSSARWAKVSSRRAGPPRERAYAATAVMSIPAVDVDASASSVAGFTSVADGALPSTQRPSTKLRRMFMRALLAQFQRAAGWRTSCLLREGCGEGRGSGCGISASA